VPIEPPPTTFEFPPKGEVFGDGTNDFVGAGADLEPGTLLHAYRIGIFPMPFRLGGLLAWWSPARRGILPLENLKIARSLRKSAKRFEILIDTQFQAVVRACGEPGRKGAWINEDFVAAYTRLHELGWAHSVEAWTPDGRLGGGLYGIAIGGLFAGESMFHRERDASKVALIGLVDALRKDGANGVGRLLDLQWLTPHLASLGAIEVSRAEYIRLLDHALQLPIPPLFDSPSG